MDTVNKLRRLFSSASQAGRKLDDFGAKFMFQFLTSTVFFWLRSTQTVGVGI
jgi:hypothetical protein